MGTWTTNDNNTEVYYTYTYDMTDDGVDNPTTFTDVFKYDSNADNHAGDWLRSEWENSYDGTRGSYTKTTNNDGSYTTIETWSDDTNTNEWTYNYDKDGNFTGGTVVENGVTTEYNELWNVTSQTADVSGLQTLSSDDGVAYELFGAAKVQQTDSWSDDWGTTVEYTYYDADGNKLGTANTSTNTWDNGTPNDTTDDITYTDTFFSDANGKYIGSKWHDSEGNSGTDKIQTIQDTEDKNGDGATDDTIKEESGSYTWTWKDDQGTTHTESGEYTFYYKDDDSWTFLGGSETRNDETTIYGKDWQILSQTTDVSDLTEVSSNDDAYTYFAGGNEKLYVKQTGNWSDEGGTSTEYTYYDKDGNKVGVKHINENTWHDDVKNKDITNTNIDYNKIDANGNWEPVAYEWSDSEGNGGQTTTSYENGVSIDLDSDGNADVSGDVRVETGSDTWTNPDTNKQETSTYTWYYDKTNGNFLGGMETNNGEITIYDDNWNIKTQKADMQNNSDLIEVTDAQSIEYKLFDDGDTNTKLYKVQTDSWSDDWGTSTEYTYYDANGNKLGTANTSTNIWDNGTPNDTTDDIINTNTYFNNANGEYIGSKWHDNEGNGGQTIVSFEDNASIDLDGDTNADITGNVRVESGSDTWTNPDTNKQETSTYTWYYDKTNGNFLGGSETRNDETTIYGKDWQILSQTADVSDLTEVPSDDDAYTYFASGNEKLYVKQTGNWSDDGGTSKEYTYYDANGNKVGIEEINENTWHDDVQNKDITNTSIDYNKIDENGNWQLVASQWSDSEGNGGETTVSFEDNASIDLDGDTNADITGNVRVESGSNTWTNPDTNKQETSTYTWYYDKANGNFLGGSETRNGETTIYGKDWQILSPTIQTIDLSTLTKVPDTDKAYSFFVDGTSVTDLYKQEESGTDDRGNDFIRDTYYDQDGNEIGESYTNTYTWHDSSRDKDITNTSIRYSKFTDNPNIIMEYIVGKDTEGNIYETKMVREDNSDGISVEGVNIYPSRNFYESFKQVFDENGEYKGEDVTSYSYTSDVTISADFDASHHVVISVVDSDGNTVAPSSTSSKKILFDDFTPDTDYSALTASALDVDYVFLHDQDGVLTMDVDDYGILSNINNHIYLVSGDVVRIKVAQSDTDVSLSNLEAGYMVDLTADASNTAWESEAEDASNDVDAAGEWFFDTDNNKLYYYSSADSQTENIALTGINGGVSPDGEMFVIS